MMAVHDLSTQPARSLPARAAVTVPARALISSLAALLAFDQAVLLAFLGHVAWAACLALCAAPLAIAISRRVAGDVPVARIGACIAVAAAVLILGGEGRLFYANIDWQVRDAALSDMIRAPWPFLYAGADGARLLRFPIGMYLLPALVGKAAGAGAAGAGAAGFALLAQNAGVAGILLALGSLLFETARARIVALVVLLAFSGMDAAGAGEAALVPGARIENWSGLQFSSTLTLAFWVPQHAISAWIGGLTFLLWRRGIAPLGTLLATLPLIALWSPLGMIGSLPFAALAAFDDLRRRRVDVADIALPAAASLLALPGLAYLAADAGRVGMHMMNIRGGTWLAAEMLEIVPILALVVSLEGARRVGAGTLAVAAACLALMPFLVIGETTDFMMRASVPSLLMLAVAAGGVVADAPSSPRLAALVAVLAVGAVTPAHEIARAILFRPPPVGRCDVAAAWQVSFAEFGTETYFARPAGLPGPLRPRRAALLPPTRGTCYDRPWQVPRGAA